jgi:putative ATPase
LDTLYVAYETAKKDGVSQRTEPVPLVIRNGVTKLMKAIGYGKGYQYAHNVKEKLTDMQCLQDSLLGREYYRPTTAGAEARYRERLL